jgi:very-short-patch-repair endonuclease
MSVSGRRDERIAAVAALQHGRISRRQLEAIGVSSSSVSWLVAKGRLFPSLRGVFTVGHQGRIELSQETEALLSVRDGAALSHWSASALWDLWAPRSTQVEVLVQDWTAASNPGVRVHRSRILAPQDLRIRSGLPVTSPARTLLDIAPRCSERPLEIAFDRAITSRVMREADVSDVLQRAGGHRGRRRLAGMLAYWSGGTALSWSEGEERLRAMIRAARLPDPLSNVEVAGHTVDFYWPEHGFVLEVDGYRFHSGRRRFEDDRRRDQDLRRAHVDVMRVTRRQVETDPYAIIAGIAAALARRERPAA